MHFSLVFFINICIIEILKIFQGEYRGMDDLYITDMDGTLLNSNGQLSAPSYNYLKLLLKQ